MPDKSTHRRQNATRAYVGIAEAATYLDVTPKTIRRMIAENRLPAYRLGSRVIKVRISDLDAALTPISGGAVR